MTPFQAIAHALTTIPTAGFSTKARSMEDFADVTQWVIVVFMILGGINFALLYRAIVRRSPRAAARDHEFRLYLALLAAGCVVIVAEIWTEDVVPGWACRPDGRLHGGLDDDDDRVLGRRLQHLAGARADDDRRRSCSSAGRQARRPGR